MTHTTHFACDEQLKKYGGKTLGCCCTSHECKEPKERVEEPKESQGEKCTRTPKCSDCNDWKELGGYPIVCKECGWHQQQDAIVCCNPDCDAGVGDVRGKYIKVSPEVEAEIRKGAVWHEKEPDFIVNIPKNTKELKRVDIMKDGKLWGSVEKKPEKCEKWRCKYMNWHDVPEGGIDMKGKEFVSGKDFRVAFIDLPCDCKPEPEGWEEAFDEIYANTSDPRTIKIFIRNLLREEKEKLIAETHWTRCDCDLDDTKCIDLQPILLQVQAGKISTGRAMELIEKIYED